MQPLRLHRFFRALFLGLVIATASAPALAENKSDIWWNPAESGRGLIVIDHETDIFVVWCTYQGTGRPIWFVMPGGTLSADRRIFEGNVYYTLSMGYGEVQVESVNAYGTAKIDFAPVDLPEGSLRFSMRYGNGGESHDFTRQQFGSALPAQGSEVTDIWWDPQNPGWGVATIQHGDGAIFAVVLSYDYFGNPTFFTVPSPTLAGDKFTGTAYLTRDSVSTSTSHFDPSQVEVKAAGFASLRFWGTEAGAGAAPTRMEFDTDVSYVPDHNLRRMPFGATR